MSDALIDQLSEDLQVIKPLPHPAKRFLLWAVAAAFYIVGCILLIGVRPDFEATLFSNHVYIFEIALMLMIALSAGMGGFLLCIPDMRGQRWLRFLAPALLVVYIIWSIIRAQLEGLHLQPIHWDHCFADGLLVGTAPMVLLMFFTMRGATTQPITQALFNAMAIAALGYVALRITCPLDTVGHSCLYHLAPFILFGLVISLLAKKIFRW